VRRSGKEYRDRGEVWKGVEGLWEGWRRNGGTVGRSVKWWKTCCEVRKGVECLVGGHVMVGGSVGR